MAVVKIIIVQDGKTCEIDLVEKTYTGTMSASEAAEFLIPYLTEMLSKKVPQ